MDVNVGKMQRIGNGGGGISINGYEPADPWDCMLDVIIDIMASQGR